MINLYKRLNNYQALFYRILLILFCTIITIYFFPKNDRFKYDFNPGEPWEYETLYAPFKFAIEKGEEELKEEQAQIVENASLYLNVNQTITEKITDRIIDKILSDSLLISNQRNEIKLLEKKIASLYEPAFIEDINDLSKTKSLFIVINAETKQLDRNQIQSLINIDELKFNDLFGSNDSIVNVVKNIISKNATSNISINQTLTDVSLKESLDQVITTRGLVRANSRIIAQGEIVEGEKLKILETLNNTYDSKVWSKSQYYWKLIGYLVLTALAFTMLLLFIATYRKSIYGNLRQLVFTYFNVVLIIVLSSIIIKWDSDFIYIIPICLVPLVLKAFFDARLGLFSHLIAVLIISFMVPNSDEYLFLQMMAGIVTILAGNEIYRRANLFITVGQIILIYIISYFAFYSIDQGGVTGWDWNRLGYFGLCGLALLFVWPLIYVYEKLFGLVSDVSLLELSDTNSKLLKELSNKAPGTFHHSLNVANIAESAANGINANAMLTRVGALYHDIGKMRNPTFFTENQGSGINPHDDLEPEDSAHIIINHTIAGIEIAKKNNLPDRIIDFIRTHHGDTLVYYFYKKAQENNENVDISQFKYPGPKPFSKETAILMIADSVEAASKSLKNPTSTAINNLVDKIITNQMSQDQFLNADLTFKEIESIKSIIKKKLASIYHVRIEYPE